MRTNTKTERNQRIVTLFKLGFSCTMIARAVPGVTRQRAQQIIQELGVERTKVRTDMMPLLPKEELKELYENQCYTQAHLIEHFEQPRPVILYSLDEYGIKRRSVKERLTNVLPKEKLAYLYIEKGLTQDEIAEEYGVLQSQVSKLMIDYKIALGRGVRHSNWKKKRVKN